MKVVTALGEAVVFDDTGAVAADNQGEIRFMLAQADMSKGPLYTVSEVAEHFFGRTDHWLRWREREGYLVLDGEPLVPYRDEVGIRKYTLFDVEKVAHALAQSGAISGEWLQLALGVVRAEALLYGYDVSNDDVPPLPQGFNPQTMAQIVASRLDQWWFTIQGVPYHLSASVGQGDQVEVLVLDRSDLAQQRFVLPVFDG